MDEKSTIEIKEPLITSPKNPKLTKSKKNCCDCFSNIFGNSQKPRNKNFTKINSTIDCDENFPNDLNPKNQSIRESKTNYESTEPPFLKSDTIKSKKSRKKS